MGVRWIDELNPVFPRSVFLGPDDLDALAVQAVHLAPDVLGFNGQFPPESTVDEDGELHGRRASVGQQGVHCGPDGPACEQHVVHEDDVQAFNRKFKVGCRSAQRLVMAAEVIAEERDVKVSAAGTLTTENVRDPIPKSLGHMDAAGLDADERRIGELTVRLHQLVCQSVEGQPELKRVDQKVLRAHGRARK